MDAIERDDRRWAQETPPGEKIAIALELMRMGIVLKRASLAAEHPEASDEEVDAMLQAWREADD